MSLSKKKISQKCEPSLRQICRACQIIIVETREALKTAKNLDLIKKTSGKCRPYFDCRCCLWLSLAIQSNQFQKEYFQPLFWRRSGFRTTHHRSTKLKERGPEPDILFISKNNFKHFTGN